MSFLFAMLSTSAWAQGKPLMQAFANGNGSYRVMPIAYVSDGNSELDGVQYIELSVREGGRIECAVVFDGDPYPDYWTFRIDGSYPSHDGSTRPLTDISFEADNWIFVDENGGGTYTLDLDKGVETLSFCHHVYRDEHTVQVSWKVELGEVEK